MPKSQIALVAVATLLLATPSATAGPLHDAVIAADIDQLKSLIASGQEDLEGQTMARLQAMQGSALMFASIKGFAEAVQALIEAGADVNAGNVSGRRPLHGAAELGRTEVTRILLGAGADPNGAPDILPVANDTPLAIAVELGHADVVDLLLAAGGKE